MSFRVYGDSFREMNSKTMMTTGVGATMVTMVEEWVGVEALPPHEDALAPGRHPHLLAVSTMTVGGISISVKLSSREADSNDPPPPSFPPPSRGRQTNRSSTLGSMNQINCRCGVPAAERTVTKDSVSKGRKFLTCNERVCNFFEWTDGISPNSASEQCPPETKTIPTKRPYSDRSVSSPTLPKLRRCYNLITGTQCGVRTVETMSL